MKVYFDGAPDRITRMRALYPTTRTARVIHAEADRRKTQLQRDAKGNWLTGAWRAFLRRSA